MQPLTSIVILTLNELEYTQRCLDSIRERTPEPYELIVVDNGSTDGTVAYLEGCRDVTLIANGENRGFGGGCNQGMAIASGDRVLLLNNDTVVTDGWLAAMHAALDADPRRGIVGPRSNHVADTQRVPDVPYDVWSLDGLEGFASEWTTSHAGGGHEKSRLIGFCMLMRREVLDDIGGFDARFGLGNFEDDDICLRAGVAGWTCWVCDDSFVHHFGSRTFAGTGIDYQQSMSRNWARFAAKWKVPQVDVGGSIGYDPAEMLATTSYDPAVHYAPFVSRPYDEERATFESRHATRLLVLADRDDAFATRWAFDVVLETFDGADPLTVVIRCDGADITSLPALEEAADAAEAVGRSLPDIVIVDADDANDQAIIEACTSVVAFGRRAAATAGFARHLNRSVVDLDDLRAGRVDITARRAA